MTEQILTQAILKEHLHYNPDTGVFTWIKKTSPTANNIVIGKMAGTDNGNGYWSIHFFSKKYKAHRLAWLYVYGFIPKNEIDHINGNGKDNRIVNLREATHVENGQNKAKFKNNTSGFIGVSFDKNAGKYKAAIRFDTKQIHLGLYPTSEEAHKAYVAAKSLLHTFNPVLRES